MNYIVDRIEEALAVCEKEDKRMEKIPLNRLPKGIKDGDILCEKDGQFSIDQEKTAQRREAAREKLDRLFGKNPK